MNLNPCDNQLVLVGRQLARQDHSSRDGIDGHAALVVGMQVWRVMSLEESARRRLTAREHHGDQQLGHQLQGLL